MTVLLIIRRILNGAFRGIMIGKNAKFKSITQYKIIFEMLTKYRLINKYIMIMLSIYLRIVRN